MINELEVVSVSEAESLRKTLNDLLCGLYYPLSSGGSISFKLDVAELEKSVNIDLSERKPISIEDKPYVTKVMLERGSYEAYVINADKDFLRVLEIYLRKYIKNIKLIISK